MNYLNHKKEKYFALLTVLFLSFSLTSFSSIASDIDGESESVKVNLSRDELDKEALFWAKQGALEASRKDALTLIYSNENLERSIIESRNEEATKNEVNELSSFLKSTPIMDGVVNDGDSKNQEVVIGNAPTFEHLGFDSINGDSKDGDEDWKLEMQKKQADFMADVISFLEGPSPEYSDVSEPSTVTIDESGHDHSHGGDGGSDSSEGNEPQSVNDNKPVSLVVDPSNDTYSSMIGKIASATPKGVTIYVSFGSINSMLSKVFVPYGGGEVSITPDIKNEVIYKVLTVSPELVELQSKLTGKVYRIGR